LELKDITLFAILATLPDSQHSINPDTWSYGRIISTLLHHRWQHYNTKHNTRGEFMFLKQKLYHSWFCGYVYVESNKKKWVLPRKVTDCVQRVQVTATYPDTVLNKNYWQLI
jgi:hypothetical protein